MSDEPIPMVLYCPQCGLQHVDEPDLANGWNNPPHKSHLCHGCDCIWRPADVPTVGVRRIETKGQADNWEPFLGTNVSPSGYLPGEPLLCEGCDKPVLRGQFVHVYRDVGEVHVDCDHPFAVPLLPTLDDDDQPMPEFILLGQPLMRFPAPKSETPSA